MQLTLSTAVTTVFSLLLLTLTPVAAQDLATPSVAVGQYTYKGCFTSSNPLTDQGPWTFQTPGYCQQKCAALNKAVMGTTKGSNCWCGDLIPDESSKVSDSQCNVKCQGYDKDMCKLLRCLNWPNDLITDLILGGGSNTWSVYLTGTDNSVGNVGGSSSSSSSQASSTTSASSTSASITASPTTSGSPSVITKASTVVVTAPGQSSGPTTPPSPSATSKPKSNTAAIAAGVVVGIVAIAAIAGGLFFFVRNRKRRAVEEEYRRNQLTNFVASGKPTNHSSMSDSRLEPSVMLQRRQSDGSIADNQDYSRRILKVSSRSTKRYKAGLTSI